MKGFRQPGQTVADQKKEKPRDQDSRRDLRHTHETRQCPSAGPGGFRKLLQTKRAKNAIVVFGHTFPAEVFVTFGTARRGLTRGMIEATLSGEIIHY